MSLEDNSAEFKDGSVDTLGTDTINKTAAHILTSSEDEAKPNDTIVYSSAIDERATHAVNTEITSEALEGNAITDEINDILSNATQSIANTEEQSELLTSEEQGAGNSALAEKSTDAATRSSTESSIDLPSDREAKIVSMKPSAVATLKKKIAMTGSVNKSFLNKNMSIISPTPTSGSKLSLSAEKLKSGLSSKIGLSSAQANTSAKLRLVALGKGGGGQSGSAAMQRQDSLSPKPSTAAARREDVSAWKKVESTKALNDYDLKNIHMAARYVPSNTGEKGKWDEMDDDDDWADTIEFEDGTKMEVKRDANGDVKLPKQVVFDQNLPESTLVGNLSTTSTGDPSIRKEERFVDDFDRSYRASSSASRAIEQLQGSTSPSKGLYNANTGRFDIIQGNALKAHRPGDNKQDRKTLLKQGKKDESETERPKRRKASPSRRPSVDEGKVSSGRSTEITEVDGGVVQTRETSNHSDMGMSERENLIAEQERLMHDREGLKKRRQEREAREAADALERKARAKQKADQIAAKYLAEKQAKVKPKSAEQPTESSTVPDKPASPFQPTQTSTTSSWQPKAETAHTDPWKRAETEAKPSRGNETHFGPIGSKEHSGEVDRFERLGHRRKSEVSWCFGDCY